jgi:NAD(P)-dependent dehydrogenase (short-subunit alcohol dehydrogenase family)
MASGMSPARQGIGQAIAGVLASERAEVITRYRTLLDSDFGADSLSAEDNPINQERSAERDR